MVIRILIVPGGGRAKRQALGRRSDFEPQIAQINGPAQQDAQRKMTQCVMHGLVPHALIPGRPSDHCQSIGRFRSEKGFNNFLTVTGAARRAVQPQGAGVNVR